MEKLFNNQKLLHPKSKHRGTKPMHPSSLRAFQKHQEHNLKHPGLEDLILAKQLSYQITASVINQSLIKISPTIWSLGEYLRTAIYGLKMILITKTCFKFCLKNPYNTYKSKI